MLQNLLTLEGAWNLSTQTPQLLQTHLEDPDEMEWHTKIAGNLITRIPLTKALDLVQPDLDNRMPEMRLSHVETARELERLTNMAGSIIPRILPETVNRARADLDTSMLEMQRTSPDDA